MASRRILAGLFALTVSLSVPFAAQAQVACSAPRAGALLPGGMAVDEATPVPLGSVVMAGLHPVSHLTFALPPSRKPEGYGGLFALDVPAAGNYRVSIASRAWIDVVQNGQEVRGRTNNGSCNLLPKGVEFALQPGKAVIQLPSNAEPSVLLLVEKIP